VQLKISFIFHIIYMMVRISY